MKTTLAVDLALLGRGSVKRKNINLRSRIGQILWEARETICTYSHTILCIVYTQLSSFQTNDNNVSHKTQLLTSAHCWSFSFPQLQSYTACTAVFPLHNQFPLYTEREAKHTELEINRSHNTKTVKPCETAVS